MREIERPPVIKTLKEFQEKEASLSVHINPQQGPQDVMKRFGEEYEELKEAVETGTREDVFCEIADIIILASSLATVYGISLEDALSSKMARNFMKYDPAEIHRLQDEEGMEVHEAVAHLKRSWDRSIDRLFIFESAEDRGIEPL